MVANSDVNDSENNSEDCHSKTNYNNSDYGSSKTSYQTTKTEENSTKFGTSPAAASNVGSAVADKCEEVVKAKGNLVKTEETVAMSEEVPVPPPRKISNKERLFRPPKLNIKSLAHDIIRGRTTSSMWKADG